MYIIVCVCVCVCVCVRVRVRMRVRVRVSVSVRVHVNIYYILYSIYIYNSVALSVCPCDCHGSLIVLPVSLSAGTTVCQSVRTISGFCGYVGCDDATNVSNFGYEPIKFNQLNQ